MRVSALISDVDSYVLESVSVFWLMPCGDKSFTEAEMFVTAPSSGVDEVVVVVELSTSNGIFNHAAGLSIHNW